jgi:EAL domain-containing protein (putative c-di-GMP-specific phosphodiesterase class I)
MGDWKKGGVDLGGPPFDLERARGPAWLIDLARRRIVDANAAALTLWSAATVGELSAVPVESAFFDDLLSQFALGLGTGALVPTRFRSPTRDDIPSVDCLAVPARLHDGGAGLILEAIALNGELVTVYDGATGVALLRNQRAANAGRPDEHFFADRFVDKWAADRLWRAVAERVLVSAGGPRQPVAETAELAVRSTDGVVLHEVRLGVLAGEGAPRIVAEERPLTRGVSLDGLGQAAEPADGSAPSARTPILRRRVSGVVAGREELKQAIEGGEIEAFFQPVIGLDGGRVIGCEALARWRRPRARPMTAGKFIAAVETAGLIWPLGDVILRHALRQFGIWAALGLGAGGRIAVNIGAQQLTNIAIVDHVQACLADAGLKAQHLAVEVTESIALGPDGALVLERLNALHDLGIEVVLDDFGTGHASLALLERLPVNRVKIDRTVVAGIDVVPSCKPIIRTVTDLAHSLSLQVVAEGVETREQMHFLQLCGCDGGQGNLFAPPMSGDDATTWLAERTSVATGLAASVPFSEIDADVATGGGLGGRRQLH